MVLVVPDLRYSAAVLNKSVPDIGSRKFDKRFRTYQEWTKMDQKWTKKTRNGLKVPKREYENEPKSVSKGPIQDQNGTKDNKECAKRAYWACDKKGSGSKKERCQNEAVDEG